MPARLDLAGKQFGRWTVLSFSHMQRLGKYTTVSMWACRCECGTERILQGRELTNGKSQSCGCLHREIVAEFCRTHRRPSKRVIDAIGHRYGRLVVISRHKEGGSGTHAYWECRCDCGNTTVVSGQLLRNGNTQSCGCFGEDRRVESTMKHGLCRTPEYRIWTGMKKRCEAPNSQDFKHYGGRGIAIEWPSFEAFLADMGKRPGAAYSIERKNNDLPYRKDNCQWSLQKEQVRNRRNTLRMTYNGTDKPVAEWAEILGMKYTTLAGRLRKGWSVEKATRRFNSQTGKPLQMVD